MNPELTETLAVAVLVAIVFVVRVRSGHPPRWFQRMRQRPQVLGKSHDRRPSWPSSNVRPLMEVAVVGVLPWLAYLILRPLVGSGTPALAAATGIPVVWAVVRWIRARHVDVIGLIVIGPYGLRSQSLLFLATRRPLLSSVTRASLAP